jgi:hypothetical protein
MGTRLLTRAAMSLAMTAIGGTLFVTAAPSSALPAASAHPLCTTGVHYHEQVFNSSRTEKWSFRNVTYKYLGSYLQRVYVWEVRVYASDGTQIGRFIRETAC